MQVMVQGFRASWGEPREPGPEAWTMPVGLCLTITNMRLARNMILGLIQLLTAIIVALPILLVASKSLRY